MFRIAIAALISIVAVACGGPRYVDYFQYHDDGTPKPKVAILPIIDSTHSGLGWDMTDEISQGIYYQLMNSGEFFVPSVTEMGPAASKVDQVDIFGTDLSYASEFTNTDFIVALELIEHTISPINTGNNSNKRFPTLSPCNRSLSIRVRIKIIDIRCQTPKIVLYEIFKTCYLLTPSKNINDCDSIGWGAPGYEKTPCGIAHDRLIRNLTARLEEVIWSVK